MTLGRPREKRRGAVPVVLQCFLDLLLEYGEPDSPVHHGQVFGLVGLKADEPLHGQALERLTR